MRLWIYDERGYPSGGAGGMTLRDYPDGEAKGVVCITARVMPGETGCISLPRGHRKFLCAGICQNGKQRPFTIGFQIIMLGVT